MQVSTGRFRFAISGLLAARSVQQVNPSFSTTIADAKRDLARIAADPRPLERPLLIISGFIDPFFCALSLRSCFRSLTRDPRIISVPLGDCLTFEQCRRRVTRALDRRLPTIEPDETEAVDVIGFSMGGVVARYAAMSADRPLRIARLFTISSPLVGADQADRLPLLHPLQKHLRTGSYLLEKTNSVAASYPILSYVRLGDKTVGAANSAVPGCAPWWVATPAFQRAHDGARRDPRILADIARRLRGEPPLATYPAAALP